MQAEKAVQVEGRQFAPLPRLRNSDGWTDTIVIGFGKGHHDIQPVGGAALEKHDELLAIGRGRRGDSAAQESRQRAHADHGYAAVLQKCPSWYGHRDSPLRGIFFQRLWNSGAPSTKPAIMPSFTCVIGSSRLACSTRGSLICF